MGLANIACAQITSFPYTEDFESPSVIQSANASCDATVAGATFTGWTQDPNDDGDWRADSAGTPSIGTGPGATSTVSGVGLGTDVNPGTTAGIYLYTEATNATSCGTSEINLLSSYFDLSKTNTYYRIQLNYHMFGGGMGSLHIDVKDTGTWTNNIWSKSGNIDSLWHLDSISLATFNSDSVQIRIRAVMGASYQSDLAIDNFVLESYTPPSADAVITSVSYAPNEYPILPLIQFDSLEFASTVKNDGALEMTNTKVTIREGTFSTSIQLDTISGFQSKSGFAATKYFPTSVGIKTLAFEATINQTEALTTNNFDTLYQIVSDTVMARETGTNTGGIGFNTGAGEIGELFKLKTGDTVTSISFYIDMPTAGDSLRAHLRQFYNGPGNVIESTDPIAMATNQNWYTVNLKCHQVLTAGEYFVGVEQMTAGSNMSLGYTTEFFTDTTCYYGNGGTWTAVEDANFKIATLTRLNFGHVAAAPNVTITSTKDTTCPGELVYLTASGGQTHQWTPTANAYNPNNISTLVDIDATTTMYVVADWGCGILSTDSFTIHATTSPNGIVSNDTTICPGGTAILKASGGNSYSWVNGPSNADYTVNPTANTLYYAIIDSTNGCSKTLETNVYISVPQVNAYGDTTVCRGSEVSVYAEDADSYRWINGPSTANHSFNAWHDDTLIVIGADSFGCETQDSVMVETVDAPNLIPMNDTGACFARFITIEAGGAADFYEWNTGSDSSSTKLQILTAQTVYLKAYNANGCEDFDTVYVERYIPPSGSVDADTTICEGSSITLSAYGGDLYSWSNGDETQTTTLSPTKQIKLTVTIKSNEGCEDFEEVTVSIDPLAKPAFKFKDYKDSVVFTNQSQLADSYHWDFGDGNTSTDENTYNIYDTTGNYTITLTATNKCGDVDSTIIIKVTVPEKVGVNELEHWNKLNIYPIPAESTVSYTINNKVFGKIDVSLIDVNGKIISVNEIFKSSTEHTNQLDISVLPSGVYQLRFKQGSSVITRKLIKR